MSSVEPEWSDSSGSGSGQRPEMVEQDVGARVTQIPGRREEDDRLDGGELEQMSDRAQGRGLAQLGPVTGRELLEATHVVPVPATQIGAGGDVLEPFVQTGVGLGHPPGPEPIHEHAISPGNGGFIDPMQEERHPGRAYAGGHRPRKGDERP